MIIKIWKDPVWSKVIATCIATFILFLIATIASYLVGLWPAIGSVIKYGWNFVNSSTTTPNWLLGSMAILCVLFIYALLGRLKDRFVEEEDQTIDFKSYTKDYFEGILWSWRYSGELIMDLQSLCPNCQYQIIPKRIQDMIGTVLGYDYLCDDCGHSAGQFLKSPAELNQIIKHKIQRRLRTGEWTEKLHS